MKHITALQVKGIAVGIKTINGKDYISLTDIARSKNPGEPKDVVKTGCDPAKRSNSLGFGRSSTILISKGSNSTPFCARPVAICLRFRHPGGFQQLTRSVWCRKQEIPEGLRPVFIQRELSQQERLVRLNLIAIRQLTTLLNNQVSATLGLPEKHSSV